MAKANPGLSPTANIPEINRSIEKHRARYYDLLTNQAKFMLAVGSRDLYSREAEGWLLFIVANASRESRERLLRLFTHPKIQPLDIQYILGQDIWANDMFDYFPRLDIENPTSIGNHLSSYIGVAQVPHDNGYRCYLYNGSATGSGKSSDLVGEARRMYEDHAGVLAMGYKEIKRRRMQKSSGRELYIHEKMACPGAKSFFVSMTRFPLMPSDSLMRKVQLLAMLAENSLTILLGTLSTDKNALPRLPSLLPRALTSQSISSRLRPKGTPAPPWHGGNKILPMLQKAWPVWSLSSCSLAWTTVRKQLREHWQQTGALTLTKADYCKFLMVADLKNTNDRRRFVRNIYNAILQEHGHFFHSWYQDWLRRLAILWVAIIRYAEATYLVRGSLDGIYVLDEEGFDWGSISRIAQSLAPPELRQFYSKHGCYYLFGCDSSHHFHQRMLYQCNWERLKRKFSCPLFSPPEHRKSNRYLMNYSRVT